MSLILMYILNMIGYMLVALPVIVIIRLILIKKTKKRTNFVNEALLVFFIMYVIGLASQTIIPQWSMGIITDTGEFYFDLYLSNSIATLNLIPFHTLSQYFFESNANVDSWHSVSLLNVTANMFLFSPLGFFIPLLWKRWSSLKKIFFFGFSTTCIIEFIQYFIGRSSDIDDVILNTIGVLIGYLIFLLCKKIFIHKKSKRLIHIKP